MIRVLIPVITKVIKGPLRRDLFFLSTMVKILNGSKIVFNFVSYVLEKFQFETSKFQNEYKYGMRAYHDVPTVECAL